MNTLELIEKIDGGVYDREIERIYRGAEDENKKRLQKAVDSFKGIFGNMEGVRLFSVPGRSEVGGNHTDHNCGRVLACAVNLDIIAAAALRGDENICVESDGFAVDTVNISSLSPREEEKGRSAALIRGVCSRLKSLGYKIGGFCAYMTSEIMKGSGLSSSAAFEVMIAEIINCLFNGGRISPVEMAKAGQYAEQEFFGKPCGLMDQTACAVGGFTAIDFKDTENPIIEKLDFDFAKTGYSLCIVDTAGNHADLSDDYAAIRGEMILVAKFLGYNTLRECDEKEFYANLKNIREILGDRTVLRAMHFFDDNARVLKEKEALKSRDFDAFLSCIIDSGRSSFMYLQNIYSISEPSRQGLSLALALAEKMLSGCGAWRVHGGGFAGTIQAFVPREKQSEFSSCMNDIFGAGACHKLSVRSVGAYCFTAKSK
jgi:galactokinase